MKLIRHPLAIFLLPAVLFGAAGDIKIDVKNSSDTGWISIIFAKQANKYIGTDSNGVPVLLNGSGGGGSPGGSSGDIQYNNAGSFGGYTPGSGVVAFLQSPTFTNLNTMLTGDDAAGLAANNVFTGVNSFVGSSIHTPATIALTSNAGTLTITKAYSNVTITANSTITPSASGVSGQTCAVYVTNSGASSFTLTIDNTGTDYVATIPAGQSRWLIYVSNATDFVLSAGDPASASVASTSRIQYQNPTTGVYFYDLVSNLGPQLSGVPAAGVASGALANGMTATSQAVHSNDTKLATDAYADRAALVGNAPNPLTESAGATTIDWSLSNTHTLTLNANLTSVTFSNATSGQTIVVAITNTGSNYVVTWGNSIKWVGGTQPVQTVGAHIDVWTIIDIGGTFYGSVVQNF